MASSPTPPIFGFRCKTCGIWHEGIPLDLAAEQPNFDIPPEERDRRLRADADFCVVDDRDHFIRACLEIPVRDGPGPLVYGVWTSLSEKSYRRARELAQTDTVPPGERPWFGWFFNALPLYPDTMMLKCLVHPRPNRLRPTIQLEPTTHPLAVEQREGISVERLVEIVQRAVHPPPA